MTPAEKILEKNLVTSGLSSSEADRVLAALKDRAFFSARCESVRHLQTARQAVAGMLAQKAEEGEAMPSRASVLSAIMESAKKEGLATGEGGLTDPGSVERARVIADTNAGLAQGYCAMACQSTDAARLAFPAQELVRAEAREKPRDWKARWTAAGGRLYGGRMAALKEDPVWSAISRFGVPYPPFDYGSGMGVEEISRREAIDLGIIGPDYAPEGDLNEDFNKTMEAQLDFKGDDDPGWQFLKDSFGDQVKHEGGKVKWQADIIREAINDPKTVRLGKSRHEASGGMNLTMNPGNFGHIQKRHLGAAEKDGRNIPLKESELAIIPHVWRTPDRVETDEKRGGIIFELDSCDGGTYCLVVRRYKQAAELKTFYKKKGAQPPDYSI